MTGKTPQPTLDRSQRTALRTEIEAHDDDLNAYGALCVPGGSTREAVTV